MELNTADYSLASYGHKGQQIRLFIEKLPVWLVSQNILPASSSAWRSQLHHQTWDVSERKDWELIGNQLPFLSMTEILEGKRKQELQTLLYQ